MNRVNPQDLDLFSRKYRWSGGRLLRVRLTHRGDQMTADVILRVTPIMRDLGRPENPVRLHLRFTGVEECRFQKRPAKSISRISDAKIGFFEGFVFANFDAWGLAPGERPAIFDFRSSEAYLAATDLFWLELPPRQA